MEALKDIWLGVQVHQTNIYDSFSFCVPSMKTEIMIKKSVIVILVVLIYIVINNMYIKYFEKVDQTFHPIGNEKITKSNYLNGVMSNSVSNQI